MGPAQFLPGYCLLLPDPVVGSLNDMAEPDRAAFLRDMALLGDAVTKIVKPRRINYEMLGNLAPALHAHIIPRRTDEPKDLRTKAVWLYPDSAWSDPATTFNPKKPAHARLKRALAAALKSLGAIPPAFVIDAKPVSPSRASSPPTWAAAAAFAARAHAGQLRKDGVTPYISHPFRVAMTVRDLFNCTDITTLTAAILHDTIEDCLTDYDDLLEHFGRPVADTVSALSKDMRVFEPIREREYEARLAAGDWRVHLIKLADVYDNLSDLARNPQGTLKDFRAKCRMALRVARPSASRPEVARAIDLVTRAANLKP